ncbi:MAG TPA: hypothetical protein VF393_04700 [archaeon]
MILAESLRSYFDDEQCRVAGDMMGFNLLADYKILERGRIIDIFGLMQQPLTTS